MSHEREKTPEHESGQQARSPSADHLEAEFDPDVARRAAGASSRRQVPGAIQRKPAGDAEPSLSKTYGLHMDGKSTKERAGDMDMLRRLSPNIQRKAADQVEDEQQSAPAFPIQGRTTKERVGYAAMLKHLAPQVQQKSAEAKSTSPEQMHAAAADGMATSSRPLPHGDQIQAAFGPQHDVSKIRAHVDPASTRAMGAEAYATGNDVVFAKEPDVELAAHEATHVVQQAEGVNLKGGLGEAGDAYEQTADAVAARVKAGQSASDLLGPSSSGVPRTALQRKETDPSSSQSGATASTTSRRTEATNQNPFDPKPRTVNQSKPGASAFAFDPPTLTFIGAGTQDVTIRNTTSEPQTIDSWQLAGDSAAFETRFVGARSLVLQPGGSFTFQVRFLSEREMPQAAALVVESMFADSPVRLNIVGAKQGQSTEQGCSSVPISGTTPEGRKNSIQSALSSVQAAWGGMLTMQQAGIDAVANIVRKDLPKSTPEWRKNLDSLIGQGLARVIGAIGLYAGGGLALATWNVLESMGLGASVRAEGAKQVAALTLKLHGLIVGSYTKGAMDKAGAAIDEAIIAHASPAVDSKKPAPSVLLREAFLVGQAGALSKAFQDAITTLNNSEGDFAALEAEHAGLGFAALEAYRSHISCHLGNVAELQRNATTGMWMSFLAQMDLGSHEPQSWEHAANGAAVEKNLYNTTDAHHRIRDLARGVLELHVIWDFDHKKTRPIYILEHARATGIHPELKEFLLTAPLGQFPVPMIVHGKVKQSTMTGSAAASHLRIGRNEGGAISIGAEPKTRSAEMLEQLGNGDTFAGARALFEHVDQLVLKKVE